MGGGGGGDFPLQPVNTGRDTQAENTLFGTAERGRDFLNQGTDQFDFASQINAALGGQIPASGLPLANTLRETNLLEQSNAAKQISAGASGLGENRNQFGAERLQAQNIAQFGLDRGQIPARVIGDVLRTLLPAQQQQNALQSTANQGGLTASQNFNPVSQGRQAQAQNRGISAANAQQPAEQKQGGGIGQIAGIALPIIGGIVGGPVGAAAGGALGGAISGGGGGGGLSLAPRNSSGGFF